MGHEGAAVVVGTQHLEEYFFAILGMSDMVLLCGVGWVAQHEGTNHQRLPNLMGASNMYSFEN